MSIDDIDDIDDIDAARRAVHTTCLRMVADRLVVGSAGNVSVRVDVHHALVTAGGVAYDKLDPADHPVVDLRDGSWSGRRAPTSELALHLGLLRARDDIGAIVHTHSRYAAAFSVARIDLGFVCNENIGPRSEKILVTEPYAPPGTEDLAVATARTLDRQPGSRACLLANHGVVAIADDLDTAYLIAAQVEWIAEVTYLARMLGGEHVLPPPMQDAIGGNYGFTVARAEPESRSTAGSHRPSVDETATDP